MLTKMAPGGIAATRVVVLARDTFKGGSLVDRYGAAPMLVLVPRVGVLDGSTEG
jgi:hypothetical protein